MSPLKRFLARLADCLGYALVPVHQGGPVEKADVNKILLIRLDHIGDVLMTTPALRALRKAYPDAEIHMAVKEETAAAVSLNPNINRIIIFNAPWTVVRGARANAAGIVKCIRRLRHEHYDCVLAFRADLREALLTRFSGAPFRIGYGSRGGGFCFTHLVEWEAGRHEIRKNLNLLRPLGVNADGEQMDLTLSPRDEADAQEILTGNGIAKDQKIAGMHPGAASPFKRWEAEGFARVRDRLQHSGYKAILLGGPGEEGLLGEIARRMKTSPPAICGSSLRVLGALIRRLDLLICNDTAPSHIAQAVGTKSVVLYGPTDEAITGPLDRKRHVVVRAFMDCRPCWRPGGRFSCPRGLQCFREITPEMVMEGVKTVTIGNI